MSNEKKPVGLLNRRPRGPKKRKLPKTEEIFTTFDVAKIVGANVNSIKKWIMNGRIHAYRTPGGHFRVQKSMLRSFLRDYGMPDPFGPMKPKVIVVDDRQDAIDALVLALGNDYDPIGVTDPYEALLRIGSSSPELVLIDIMMPGLDGVQVIARLHDMESLAKTRIIAYSGDAKPSVKKKALEAGAHAFWSKSENLSSLLQTIEEVMDVATSTPPRRAGT